MQSKKIFCIGLSKTGTTSLARALEILGYRTRDYIGVTRYASGDLSSVDLAEIDASDAFTDTPIPSFYRELDKKYPGSKFILTTRNMDDWLRSCAKQFTSRIVSKQNDATRQLHTDLYGCFEFDAGKYASGYTRFVEGVLDYFRDRPQDLLVTDICGGETWDELCAFLGKSVPESPFPVTNVSAIQWMNIRKIVDLAREAGVDTKKRYMRNRRGRCLGEGNRLACLLHALSARFSALLGKPARDTRESDLQQAIDGSRNILVEGLKKMNPSIPVLTPADAGIPHTERAIWSHFWMIDPLDGAEEFADHSGPFTINIALIEGSRPVWGVVYNPLEDTVYYAKGASGCYLARGSDDPEPLGQPDVAAAPELPVILSAASGLPEAVRGELGNRHGDYRLVHARSAMALCLLAEGKAAAYVNAGPTQEWETAAGHAIARAAGKQICSLASGEELAYNKETLVNDGFIAE